MGPNRDSRFRTGIDGRVYDTQIHPKVKRAQEAHAAILRRIAERKLQQSLAIAADDTNDFRVMRYLQQHPGERDAFVLFEASTPV